jgi:hypothetical protein
MVMLAQGASATATANITGTWNCCGAGGAAPQIWILKQSGSTLTGIGKIPSGTVFASIRGTISGNKVVMHQTYNSFSPGYTAIDSGTLAANGRTMVGKWTSNAGQAGTFTATLTGKPRPTTAPTTSTNNLAGFSGGGSMDGGSGGASFGATCSDPTGCSFAAGLGLTPDQAAQLSKFFDGLTTALSDDGLSSVSSGIGNLIKALGAHSGPEFTASGSGGLNLLSQLNTVLQSLQSDVVATGDLLKSGTLSQLDGKKLSADMGKALDGMAAIAELNIAQLSPSAQASELTKEAVMGLSPTVATTGGSGILGSILSQGATGSLSSILSGAIDHYLDVEDGTFLPGGAAAGPVTTLLGSLTSLMKTMDAEDGALESGNVSKLEGLIQDASDSTQKIGDSLLDLMKIDNADVNDEPSTQAEDNAADDFLAHAEDNADFLAHNGENGTPKSYDAFTVQAQNDQKLADEFTKQAQDELNEAQDIAPPSSGLDKSINGAISGLHSENDDFLTPQSPSAPNLDSFDTNLDDTFAGYDSEAAFVTGPIRTILSAKAPFQAGPVVAALTTGAPTKAQLASYKATVALARSHHHSLARTQARVVLLVAAAAGWNQDARALGLDPATGTIKHAHLLGSTKLKAKHGAHVRGTVEPTAPGGRMLGLIGLSAPAKLATVQLTVSDGHGKQASRTVSVH